MSKTVFYYRVQDLGYPRNSRIRAFLGRSYLVRHHEKTRKGNHLRRIMADLVALWAGSRNADVVVVSEFNLSHAAVAWFATRSHGAVLVVDGFVRLYETAVEDLHSVARWSMAAFYYRAIDRLSLMCADIYLIDTKPRATTLELVRRRDTRVFALPVGAPEWTTFASRIPCEPRRILFYGSYLPLHGVDLLVTAFARLREPAQLTLIGSGGNRSAMEALVAALGLGGSVTFVDSMSPAELVRQIHLHDVVAGVFGPSTKARSVIANKVWQGLACGRIVVTQSSEALAELRAIAGDALVESDPGDVESLANALNRALTLCIEPAVDISGALARSVDEQFQAFGSELRMRIHTSGTEEL